jgi:hypothetical protein
MANRPEPPNWTLRIYMAVSMVLFVMCLVFLYIMAVGYNGAVSTHT